MQTVPLHSIIRCPFAISAMLRAVLQYSRRRGAVMVSSAVPFRGLLAATCPGSRSLSVSSMPASDCGTTSRESAATASVDDSGIYTETHWEMRRALRKLIDAEINPHVDEWEEAGIFPAHKVFKALGSAGFLGVTKPPAYGGLGLDFTYGMAVAEEMGSIHCGGVPMAVGVQTEMATPALARFGSDELRVRSCPQRPASHGCTSVPPCKHPRRRAADYANVSLFPPLHPPVCLRARMPARMRTIPSVYTPC